MKTTPSGMGSGLIVKPSVAATWVLLGGFIFYNTNVLNAFGASDENEMLRAEYEKRFGRFAEIVQPCGLKSQLERILMHPA